MATAHRKVSVEEFLAINFEPDGKFELVDGVIHAMTGGSPTHARVQANLMRFLGAKLRGSGCRPYGSDMPMQTLAHTLRYPDVSIYCGDPASHEGPAVTLLPNPVAVIEVLSPTTRAFDEGRKLEEYQSLASVVTVALVDPEAETVAVFQRSDRGRWDDILTSYSGDIELPSLGVAIPKAEIFARD